MALALDVTSNSGHLANVSSATFSHTATGSNLILVVLVAPGDPTLGDRTVSSVTYNGVSLTHIAADSDRGYERTEAWYLINPPTGAHNVVVTMGGSCENLDVYSITLTGAKQTGQPDASHSRASSSASPVTDSVTTVADNSYVVSVAQTISTQTTGLSAGQSSIGFLNTGWTRASYSGPKTPAGSVTHGYTVASSTDGAMTIVSIAPSVDITTTKTQTGVSRITVTTTKTQTGKARITATTQKTQIGISRITATTQKNQTGVANIRNTTTKTQTGKSRITATTPQTQTGKSRITITTLQTQTGKSRLTVVTPKNQSGVSRITSTAPRTQQGVSRITITTPQTQTGKSRITATSPKTQTGVSNIRNTTLKTQDGTSRITNTTVKTQTGIARIGYITTRNQTGITRITNTTPQTQTGKSRITTSTPHTITGVSRITITTQKNQTGVADIQVSTIRTITGTAYIQIVTLKTQTGVANIQAPTYTRTQQIKGVSRISSGVTSYPKTIVIDGDIAYNIGGKYYSETSY